MEVRKIKMNLVILLILYGILLIWNKEEFHLEFAFYNLKLTQLTRNSHKLI